MITFIPTANNLIPIGIKISVQQHTSAIPQIPIARGTRINSQIQALSKAPVILNPNQNIPDKISMNMINVNIFLTHFLSP